MWGSEKAFQGEGTDSAKALRLDACRAQLGNGKVCVPGAETGAETE